MFLVTTNRSEQDIESSIRHVDRREEAKDRGEMERALSGNNRCAPDGVSTGQILQAMRLLGFVEPKL